VLFWIIAQRVVAVPYWRFGTRLSRNVGKELPLRFVINQKSAVLIYFVAEARFHPKYTELENRFHVFCLEIVTVFAVTWFMSAVSGRPHLISLYACDVSEISEGIKTYVARSPSCTVWFTGFVSRGAWNSRNSVWSRFRAFRIPVACNFRPYDTASY